MTELNFTLGSYSDSLAQITSRLGSPSSDHCIIFDGLFADGTVLLIALEEGLYIKAWDFMVNENTVFHMEAESQDAPMYFSVHYFLTHEAFRINTGGAGKEYNHKIKSNILFSSNQSHFAYKVIRRINARSLEICFSEDWLQRQFSGDRHRAETLLSQQVPGINCFLKPFTIKDYELCNELVSHLFTDEANGISIKANIFQLLEGFMKVVFEGLLEKQNSPFDHQQLKIREVARFIESWIAEKLPNIEDIAAEFSMSTSTLKRHFKSVFGKNVYEYYLEKKMKLAMHLLRQEKLSVTEVAYKLGYEKVSSFTKVFKEHFGATPKDFSKSDEA